MKPFNLADALTKEPVQLRNGLVATVVADLRQVSNYKGEYPLIIVLEDGHYAQVMEDGRAWTGNKSGVDIVGMWEKPKAKRFINGIEVSEPVTEETWVDGESYWYVAFDTSNMTFERCLRYHFEIDKRLIEQGLVFKTKEEAEAMAKALLNYKVEYKDGSCEETNKNNSGWIDINEKLPPFETEVLGRCIVDNEELIIIVSRESQDGEYWFSPVNFSGVCEDETVEVTHWQPLPELPQNQA
ncbi:DUF551 domain-containing protein [Gallibacterium sp. ZY190522]